MTGGGDQTPPSTRTGWFPERLLKKRNIWVQGSDRAFIWGAAQTNYWDGIFNVSPFNINMPTSSLFASCIWSISVVNVWKLRYKPGKGGQLQTWSEEDHTRLTLGFVCTFYKTS